MRSVCARASQSKDKSDLANNTEQEGRGGEERGGAGERPMKRSGLDERLTI